MKLKFLLITFLVQLTILSCTYDKKTAQLCDDSKKSNTYEKHLKTNFETNCATSGCHVQGAITPDLSSLDKIKKFEKRVETRVEEGTMPPKRFKVLSVEERNDIICWIKNGAK